MTDTSLRAVTAVVPLPSRGREAAERAEADAVRAAAIEFLAGVLPGVRNLEADVAGLAPGPVQFGTSAEAMELAWIVDGEQREIAAFLGRMRAVLESELAQLRAGGDLAADAFSGLGAAGAGAGSPAPTVPSAEDPAGGEDE